MLEQKDKELAMKILQVIMDDMGHMAAKRLAPKQVSVEIAKAAPEGDDDGEHSALGMPEGTPEEEAMESPEEEGQEQEAGEGDEEDLAALPRWKQRMRQHMLGK